VVEVARLNVAPVASFHVIRDSTALANVARLARDRRSLAHTDGLRFWRLCGTGAGSTTAGSSDLRRRAVFALWESEDALDTFVAASLLATRWRSSAEYWHVRLAGAGGHGAWRGVDVPGVLGTPSAPVDGPIAVITRADVRLRTWRAFSAARPAIDRELHEADGLLAVLGFGEAPIGRQATFSLWSSSAAARAFAYTQPEHRKVIERTRREQWYGEEMFARFAPYASMGTWDGIDPLASAR
jgi:heme-degrading monooxygenase HmoA